MLKNKILKFSEKPYLAFLPLLMLYIVIVLVLNENKLIGDEKRYWGYATNLLTGIFNYKDKLFWSGPGYPIILMPFALFKTPFIIPKLLNAIFLYLAIVFNYKTLSLYIKKERALLLAILLGFYYPISIKMLPFMLTEILTFLLISLITYYLLTFFIKKENKDIILISFLIGYLIMVKIIFAYVIKVLILIAIVACVISKGNLRNKWTQVLKINLLALLFCIPYLVYSYQTTNKLIYWGNSGGLSLYWMSSPYKTDLGDWFYYDLDNNQKLIKNHGSFMKKISKLSPVEKDETLKAKAIENIKNKPLKFLNNWCANLGRLFFNYPYSYNKPSIRIFFYLIPQAFVFVFGLIATFLSITRTKEYPFELILLMLLVGVYLGGVSLLSAYIRFFYILLPIIYVWICYTFTKVVSINLNNNRAQ